MTWTTEDAGVSYAGRGGEPAAFEARETAVQVAADMNAAFRTWVDVGPSTAPRGVRGPGFTGDATDASPMRARLNLLTAVSVGVLVGISVGAYIARPHRPPNAQSPSPSIADAASPLGPSTPIRSAAAASPAHLRVETEPAPTVQTTAPWGAEASAPRRIAASAGAAGAALADRRGGDIPWAGRRTLAWNAPPPRRAQPSASYRRTGWGGRDFLAPPASVGGGRQDCVGQVPERRRDCLIAASGRADAALRANYREAAIAGVPNEVLEQDTRAWNELRSRGGEQPEKMIAGYRRLAATLRAQAAAARGADLAPAPGYDQAYPPWY